jgi:hypothetical protein
MVGIYKITSPSGKIYIGQSVEIKRRFNSYKRMYVKNKGVVKLYRSFLKYGADNHIFEVVCEYPTTPPEIATHVKAMGIDEDCFRVRGSSEPTEVDQVLLDDEPSGEAMLDKQDMDKGAGKIKHKDYFGDDFNKGFLKDLSKTAKQRTKDGFAAEYKIPKQKTDKVGSMSPMSNAGKPDPRKGN